MRIKIRNTVLLTISILLFFSVQKVEAQLQNIPCSGFNIDEVADGIATSQSSTTADIDGNGYVFVSNTFKPGTTICNTTGVWNTSMATSGTSGLTYTLQSPSSNNALQVVPGGTGTLMVTNPVAVNNLSILALGGGAACSVTITVTFTDQSTQIFFNQTIQDWCIGSSPVTSQFYRTLRSTSSSCGTALCPYMFELNLPIYSTNQYRKVSSISFTNAIGVGFLNVFAIGGFVLTALPTCNDPYIQPTALTLTPGSITVGGSFAAAAGADSYLIVRSSSNTLSASPVNGTSYPVGSSFGGGTIVSYQSSTSFTDNGPLTQGTGYYYYIFAANSNCTTGPRYYTPAPLSGSTTTTNSIAAYTFTTSSTWTCPAGVSSINVECWGGGGGGGYGGIGTGSSTRGGGGGGGGAYTQSTSLAVTPNNQYAVIVGSFGAAGLISISNGDAGSGGASSFGGSLVVANGGGGGKSYGNGATAGAGGAAGTYKGGNGASGSSTNSGGGGGGAGSTSAGGAGSGATAGAAGSGTGGGAGGAGSTGNWIAGGFGTSYGGGGGGGTTSNVGGAGAPGAVIITLPCVTPSAQATNLLLTPTNTTVAGSFTAASPAANGYLVIRTTTSSQPSNPVDGITYTVGASALGGVILSAGASTTFSATGLSTGTQYWFWVYSFNNSCTGGPTYRIISPLSGNTTTLSLKNWIGAGVVGGTGGTDFNTAANWSPTGVPGPTDQAIITTTTAATITLSANATVGYLTILNNTTSAGIVLALDAKTKTMTVNYDLTADVKLAATATTLFSLRVGNSPGAIIINGNAYLGTNGNTTSFVEFMGSGNANSTGSITFKGNVTFGSAYNPKTANISIASMKWDGTGTQTIYTNNSRIPLLNANCTIGGSNAPTVIVSNSYSNGLKTYNANNSLTVNAGSTLDLSTNTWNQNAATGTLTVNGTLNLAGSSGGQTGSNFPLNYSTITLATNSTINYNSAGGVSQTIYNTPIYGNLSLTNGSGVNSTTKTAGGALTLAGNLLINPYVTFDAGTYSHSLKGNWINNGTFTAGSSTITLNGTALQTIGDIGISVFNNLTINNSAGVSMINNFSVSGTLTLTAGILTTGAYIIDLVSTGAIVETTPSVLAPTSYVTGSVKATRTLIQNTNNTFGGLGVEIKEANFDNNVTQVIRTTGTGCSANGKTSIKRYFSITPTVDAGLNGTMVFHYTNSEIAGHVETNIKIYKSIDNLVHWTKENSSIDVANNKLTLNGITSFSDWTGSDTINANLPIKLLYFEANKSGNNVTVSWATATEINNDFFTIERSTDGKNWTEIYKCTAAGTSLIKHSYTYLDNNPKKGINYYRLKQTDYNGDFSYSKVQNVFFDDKVFTATIYPNPASAGEVRILLTDIVDESVNIEIVDSQGKQICLGEFEIIDRQLFLTLNDMYVVAPGLYFVSITSNNVKLTKMLVIK